MNTERTIVFADIAGSTRIIESLGDAKGLDFIAGVLNSLSETVHSHGGQVVKLIGDAVMASFEAPSQAVSASMQMQQSLSAGPIVSGVAARVKIGLHGGPVILEGGDVYGDVVNVAARVGDLAKGGQILTTAELIQSLDTAARVRHLGDHAVRGRGQPIGLVEIIWEVEIAGLTTVLPQLDRGGSDELQIGLHDKFVSFSADESSAPTIGRGLENRVVVPDDAASRTHATIRARAGRFYLADHSTNGTHLAPADQERIFVHRDEVLLKGEGKIRLGRDFSDPYGETLTYRVGSKD